MDVVANLQHTVVTGSFFVTERHPVMKFDRHMPAEGGGGGKETGFAYPHIKHCASCSAEIREFPGSHCPASPGGQKNWQGAWWNVRKMPEAKTAGSSAPCTPRPVPFTLHSPLESPLRLTFKPSLPLAGCGALGKWLCLFVPQFPHLQNGAAGGERLPAFLHILL